MPLLRVHTKCCYPALLSPVSGPQPTAAPPRAACSTPRWSTRFHVQDGRQEVMSCTNTVVGMFKELIEVRSGVHLHV